MTFSAPSPESLLLFDVLLSPLIFSGGLWAQRSCRQTRFLSWPFNCCRICWQLQRLGQPAKVFLWLDKYILSGISGVFARNILSRHELWLILTTLLPDPMPNLAKAMLPSVYSMPISLSIHLLPVHHSLSGKQSLIIHFQQKYILCTNPQCSYMPV